LSVASTETQPQQELSAEERSARLKKAYSSATARLREEKREEFDGLYAEEAQKLGVTYTPRPNAEQKAEQELNRLLEEFPHLRDRLTQDDDQS
jgi:hypothetical protein